MTSGGVPLHGIRAIGAASCTDDYNNGANYATYINLPCPSMPAPATRFTYDSNPGGDGAYTARQFTSTNALFQSFDGCSSSATALDSNCSQYQSCSAPFISCAYPGMGHTRPSDWANATWSFFAGF